MDTPQASIPKPPADTRLAEAHGSALRAADAWNDEGRTCLRAATIETARGEYVNALYHQRNAQVAFAHELEIRKMLNR